jgi:chemotaxis-related protein WspB
MLAVTFRVADAAYAIRCERVVAVIPRVTLRPLAHAVPALRGVFAYRGELTWVIDLCQLIAGYACSERLSSRIALVRCALPQGGQRCIGLLAEHMTEARHVDETSTLTSAAVAPYLGNVILEGSDPLQLLDVDGLLPSAPVLLSTPAPEGPEGGRHA